MTGVDVGAVVDVVLAAERRSDGDPVRLAERGDRRRGLGRPAALADDRERPLRAARAARRAGPGRSSPGAGWATCAGAASGASVSSNSTSSGSASTTGPGRPPSATENARATSSGRRSARVGLGSPLGEPEPAERVRVVELLERVAAEERTRRLADEQDHRRRVLRGDVHPDARVRRARPARDEADARPAGQLPVRLGHVGGGGLVAARDQADVRVVQRVEHGQVALARDAERVLDAVQLELVDEDLAAGARQLRARSGARGRRSRAGASASPRRPGRGSGSSAPLPTRAGSTSTRTKAVSTFSLAVASTG